MSAQSDRTAETAINGVGWLQGVLAMTEARYENASAAGAELAAVVAQYVGQPQEVGRAALREAYGRFMAAHAGNFTPMEAIT